MITDPHDPRQFRRWVTVAKDGTVAAIHDVEASVEHPFDGAVDVTDLGPVDFRQVTVDPALMARYQKNPVDTVYRLAKASDHEISNGLAVQIARGVFVSAIRMVAITKPTVERSESTMK